MVSVSRSLQERLTASLAAVGYKKDAGILPASLESNPKLLNFLEWTVSQIECVNHVTTEQAKRLCICVDICHTLPGLDIANQFTFLILE